MSETITLNDIADRYGGASQVEKEKAVRFPNYRPNGERSKAFAKRRIARRNFIVDAFLQGHPPEAIAEFIRAPRFAILHALRMHATYHYNIPYDTKEDALFDALRNPHPPGAIDQEEEADT
jgi:hypothetical protein